MIKKLCYYCLAFCCILACKTPKSEEGAQGGDAQAAAQNYPDQPISYLVPWKAGGGTDISSRTLGVVLQKLLDQPINVINRTGGGGVVGHSALANADPDGYTLGAITGEITMMHWMGLTELTYEDFTPLALITNNAASITVKADAPWQTLDDLLTDIRNNPGKFMASGTARGGIWDLARIGFLKTVGLPETAMPWVPSQGANPALQELIAGGVDVVTAALAEVDGLRKAGQVRTLAVMADERLPAFPDVPTLKEQGVDWSIGGWVGFGAPKGLNPAIRAKLDENIRKAVSDPLFIEPLQKAGFYIQYLDAQAFEKYMQEADRINGELMKEAGIAR